MNIAYDTILIDVGGDPFQNDKGKPLTLQTAIIMACTIPLQGDESMSPMEKYGLGEIAFLARDKMTLATEQVSKIKDRVAKLFTNPALVYVAWKALEGELPKKSGEKKDCK
jgi:hypothetical protein